MTATLFILYLILMIGVVATLSFSYLPRAVVPRIMAALAFWLSYAGLLSYFGVIANPALRPPGPLLIFVPFLIFLVCLVGSSAATRIALAFPPWVLLATQSFRIGVELLLHRMWHDGTVPRMLTYSGANVDLYIGLSAPLAAWISTRGRQGLKMALAWNFLGLLALTNVLVRAILTAPGPLNLIHDDFRNLAIGKFPYTFLPAFFVLLAASLHVLSIKALRSQLRSDQPLSAHPA